jgi:cytoskeleton protein RodZ
MSTNFSPEQEGHAAAEPPDGCGGRLRAARLARGLDLDRVAGELHLTTTVIESLERDDYEALPGRVFVVGYLRKYARLLGLDPEPLLAAYQARAPRTEPLHNAGTSRPDLQTGSSHLVVRLVSALLLVLLAALTYVWWVDRQPVTEAETDDAGVVQDREMPQETETASASAPEVLPQPQVPAPIGAVGAEPGAASMAPETAAGVQSPAPEPRPSDEAYDEPATAASSVGSETGTGRGAEGTGAGAGNSELTTTGEGTEASAQGGEGAEGAAAAATDGEIVMSFAGPCWVDVRGSDHKYKLFGEMKKGDRRVLGGTPPYSVILGNAAAVTITVDGKAVDLSAKSKGNVARFTLDPSATP